MLAPAALAAVPLLAGAATSISLIDVLGPAFAATAAAASLMALVAAAAWFLMDDPRPCAGAAVAGCLLAGLSLGATAAWRACEAPLLKVFERPASEGPLHIEGTLREDAVPAPWGLSLVLDVTAAGGETFRRGTGGGVRLSIAGTLAGEHSGEWRAGRTLRMPATLRLPSVYLNPGARDDRQSLARRGIVLVGGVKSAALVEVTGRGGRVSEWAGEVRAWTRRRVAARMSGRDPRAAGVTTAVLIGDRSGLSPEDERRMQEAGTYHVIAISGGNIAILAGVVLLAARMVLVPARVAAIGTAAFLMFYGCVAAGAASVSRAVTVAVLVLAARTLDQRGPGLNVLAIAAVLAVAARPLAVFDAGFILSFGATLGILLGVPLIVTAPAQGGAGGWRRCRRWLVTGLVALFAATACAEIALAPVGATLFSRVPLAGLLLNFAAIPLMTVVQLGGLVVTAAAGWWEWAADAGALAARWAAAGLLESARVVDAAPWLSVAAGAPVWWLTAIYYAAAIGLLHAPLRRAAAAALAAAGALVLAGPPLTSRDAVAPSPVALRVVVLDVGQGDATLIATADGHALLVDAGGIVASATAAEPVERPVGFDVGERVVVPALRALRATALDALVLTHGDADHVLGARGVLRSVRARSVWEGVPVPPNPELRAIAVAARRASASWRTVQAGDVERFGDVEVRVLHPPLPDWERQRVRNEDSVVLEVRLGRVSIVLPGDVGREGERAMLPRLEPGRLVVLKAPHHGSATSSTQELIEVLRPAAVIFSCGRENRFGHPHPAVVGRYAALGAELFSTAEDGAVFVETDGASIDVWGWAGRGAASRGGLRRANPARWWPSP